jgi:hypothetical protein
MTPRPTLPLISKPLTTKQLRWRVVARLARLGVNGNGNGKTNGKVHP